MRELNKIRKERGAVMVAAQRDQPPGVPLPGVNRPVAVSRAVPDVRPVAVVRAVRDPIPLEHEPRPAPVSKSVFTGGHQSG